MATSTRSARKTTSLPPTKHRRFVHLTPLRSVRHENVSRLKIAWQGWTSSNGDFRVCGAGNLATWKNDDGRPAKVKGVNLPHPLPVTAFLSHGRGRCSATSCVIDTHVPVEVVPNNETCRFGPGAVKKISRAVIFLVAVERFAGSMWICTKAVICNNQNNMHDYRLQKNQIQCGSGELGVR